MVTNNFPFLLNKQFCLTNLLTSVSLGTKNGLQVGCPMAVKHNEVAPGQHEMSPVFRTANVSCDSNVWLG